MKKLAVFCKDTLFCDYALKIIESYYSSNEIVVFKGHRLDKFPLEEVEKTQFEGIISFLSPWIIPSKVLNMAGRFAINFHPGSANYPGIGCYNFALYESVKEYGVVCHHMAEKVDSGNIAFASNFKMAKNESVETLKMKSLNHLLLLLEQALDVIQSGEEFPVDSVQWQRKPFTRKELDALGEIDPAKMDEVEIEKRIRASYYPGFPGAYIYLGDRKFILETSDRKPIV